MDESDKDYDVAFITNHPSSLHFATIQEMVKRVRHLFIEKPLFNHCIYNLEELALNQVSIYYVATPFRKSNTYSDLKKLLPRKKSFLQE